MLVEHRQFGKPENHVACVGTGHIISHSLMLFPQLFDGLIRKLSGDLLLVARGGSMGESGSSLANLRRRFVNGFYETLARQASGCERWDLKLWPRLVDDAAKDISILMLISLLSGSRSFATRCWLLSKQVLEKVSLTTSIN